VSNIILFHGDLDGLYSGLLFYHSTKDEINIDEVRSIEYGQDHSTLQDQFDEFFVFDFAENPGGKKTTLWVDHHLRQGENGAELSVIEESPSCVRLMLDKGIIKPNLITKEDAQCIDIVDSASYVWSSSFTKEDLILPDPNKGRLSKFVVLNQLLRKNRKSGLAEKLFATESVDVSKLLEYTEKDKGPKTTKYAYFMQAKEKLMKKMMSDMDKYIKCFSDIPVLFTKDFSFKDWKGYDFNLFAYLVSESPYVIVVFDFSSGVNIQIMKNVFYEGKIEPMYEIIKEEVDDPRGHEGIINMSFTNSNAAIVKIDKIVTLLSDHVR